MLARRAKLGKPEQIITQCGMSVPAQLWVVQALPNEKQLLSGLPSDLDFPTPRVSHAQPKQCAKKRPLVCISPAGQFQGSRRCALAVGRSEASCEQRR